jgi:hypothetical protein
MQVQPVPVFDATAACRESFVKCQKVEGLMKEEWAENRLADFNLWASGIGASARNQASLDARLALSPDARDVIANLLRLLNTVVEECMILGRATLMLRLSIVVDMIHVDPSSIGYHSEKRRS